MFFRKITSKSKGKEYTYLKLIENYREGGKVKQRVVANLGSMENLTPEKVESLISGLSRICGLDGNPVQLESKKVLQYGEVLALHKIWEILDIEGCVRDVTGDGRQELNVALLLELMALNQALRPQNKQAISEWYRYLYLPELEGKELLPHHFYRVLDLVGEFKDNLEKEIFKKLNNFFPIDTDIVYCGLLTGTIEPSPRQELNLSAYGSYFLAEPAEENRVDFGLLVSRDGMPFGHKMLAEAAEESSYREIVSYLNHNYGATRCIFVGDRGLAANPGLEVLIATGYEYLIRPRILSSRERILVTEAAAAGLKGFQEVNEDFLIKEIAEGGIRYLLGYDLKAAEQKRVLLEDQLSEVEEELKAIQKTAAGQRWKKTSLIKNKPFLKDKFCLKYFNWHYHEAGMEFSYQRRDDLIKQEKEQAGLFILETNNTGLPGRELLRSYAGLSQMGDFFREIKSFEARPSKLKAELNLTANIFVCVLASAMEKTLERIVRRAGINLTSRQALGLLEEIKVTVNQLGGREIKSVTSIGKVQEEIFQAVGVRDLKRNFI